MAPRSATVARALPFPAKAMMDCGAILGKRGAGKSSLARLLFEHEVDSGHRGIFIDPMGDAAGLRLNPDKTPSRFQEVLIFGGPRADIPLTHEDGDKAATIIGGHAISCIIDLSEMLQAEQFRFMTAFAGTLYDRISVPAAVMVDEAHIFAPQERSDAPSLLLNRMARLQAQGRKRGIFLWLMTQRPARINKNVLAGTETLIAMKMSLKHDLDAMEAWLSAHDPDKASEIRRTIAKLAPGEAWVWSPGVEFLDRVQFPMHSTLDTGRTPLHGEAVGGVEIPKANVGELAAAFSSMSTGDPRDDEIEVLRKENDSLREIVRKRAEKIDDLKAKLATVTGREGALIDILLDMQHRIGAAIGSPRIHALPAGELFDDYVMVPDSGGDVRPYLRQADNLAHIGAARRRMDRARLPTRLAPKGRQ